MAKTNHTSNHLVVNPMVQQHRHQKALCGLLENLSVRAVHQRHPHRQDLQQLHERSRKRRRLQAQPCLVRCLLRLLVPEVIQDHRLIMQLAPMLERLAAISHRAAAGLTIHG